MHRRSCSSERNVPETNLEHLGRPYGSGATRARWHARSQLRDSCALPTATQAPQHTRSQPPPSKPASTAPTSAPTRLEPTCFTDIVWQADKSAPGTCIPESRACLSRQSSLERKASATDKCPTSLRTASHFLCPGNGTLFYDEKRYVRYGAAFLFGKVPIRTPNEGS